MNESPTLQESLSPFFGDGTVAGSITVTVPRYRIADVDIPAVVTTLHSAATQISNLLSVRGTGPETPTVTHSGPPCRQ